MPIRNSSGVGKTCQKNLRCYENVIKYPYYAGLMASRGGIVPCNEANRDL